MDATYELLLPDQNIPALETALTELTDGAVLITRLDDGHHATGKHRSMSFFENILLSDGIRFFKRLRTGLSIKVKV